MNETALGDHRHPLPTSGSLVPCGDAGEGRASDLSRLQKRRKRFLVLALLLLLPLTATIRPYWEESDIAVNALPVLGMALLAVCILGRCWCTLYIGAFKKDQLVTTGPYSLCRNPLYVFSCLAGAALGLMSGSLSMGVLFLGVVMLVFAQVALREEAYLAQQFGESYARYRASTPRWWPVGHWRDEMLCVTRPGLLLITLRDGCLLYLLWPLFMLLELLRDNGLVPILFILP